MILDNAESGDTLMESYQKAFVESDADIIAYVHDDLVCLDPFWLQKVENEFSDPSVGLVGFAGALGHGDPMMYTKPYQLSQLGRSSFRSNLKEAEKHGERFTGACDVAVLDGLALFVRREVLEKCGGWPQPPSPIDYIAYDYWISCMTRRLGYRIRLAGVDCDHLGGKSTGLNPNLGDAKFQEAHWEIYDNFRDVLPYRVREGK